MSTQQESSPLPAKQVLDAPVAREHLVVILAHPDDEAFGTAGTLAMHRAAGVPATFVCATYGDMGRNHGKPFFANRETLRDVRERELKHAAETLDVELLLLGHRDKTLEFEDASSVADRIAHELMQRKADLVISFYPGRGVHPDHDAIGEATYAAVHRFSEHDRPTLWAITVTDREATEAALGAPDVEMNVGAYRHLKRAALMAHASQTKAMFDRMERGDPADAHLKERLERGERAERFYDLTFAAPR